MCFQEGKAIFLSNIMWAEGSVMGHLVTREMRALGLKLGPMTWVVCSGRAQNIWMIGWVRVGGRRIWIGHLSNDSEPLLWHL